MQTCTDIITIPNPALCFASVTGLVPLGMVRRSALVLDVEDATVALDDYSIFGVGGSFCRYNPRFALWEKGGAVRGGRLWMT